MKYEYYYIDDNNGNSNCVIRSMCKILNKEYSDVYNELQVYVNNLNANHYTDIVVFEQYMKDHNIIKITDGNKQVKDLLLDNGSYIVFCYDKKDYYHMIPIINNIIYDKNDNCLNLYVFSVYRKV